MARLSARLLALATTLVLIAPAAAFAQDATVDPNSPSGTEYAIPVEDARDKASKDGDRGEKAPGDRSAPLFGEGIEREKGGDGAGESHREDQDPSGSNGGSGGGSGLSGRGGSQVPGDGGSMGPDAVPTSSKTAGSGLSGPALSAGLTALALLSGVGVGVLARRRRREP